MRRSKKVGRMVALCAALPVFAAAQEAAPAAEPAATVDATWVERQAGFTYMAFTSYYSCDGLRDKVRWILKELGAKPGFKVRSRGCIEAQGPELFPGVEIVAEFPAPVAPDTVAAPAATFKARTRRVEFKSGRTSLTDLQDGDCELMEQLVRHDVFGKLGARVVDAQTSCVPGQVTLGAVRMVVEVLEPVPEQ